MSFYIRIFSVKSFGYMNNINLVALHVSDVHKSSFTMSSQGCLVKFDAILMLLIGSLV